MVTLKRTSDGGLIERSDTLTGHYVFQGPCTLGRTEDEARDEKGCWRVESGGTFTWLGRGVAYRTVDEAAVLSAVCTRCGRSAGATREGLRLQARPGTALPAYWICIEGVDCGEALLQRPDGAEEKAR